MPSSVQSIVTHPGSAHKDEFLACSVLLAFHPVVIWRRDPTPDDLGSPRTCVVDCGGEHDPARRNFDHHQFDKHHPPVCALSLVLQAHGLYEDALLFCDWLETAEWLDARGPVTTAAHLGVDREVLSRLNSPIDISLLRRFSTMDRLNPEEPLWEIMRFIGEDLVSYLASLRDRLQFLQDHVEVWTVDAPSGHTFEALFLPRTDPLPSDPSFGIDRFLVHQGAEERVVALIYPDRRGTGYGLSRHRDSLRLDFSPLENEEDVHFAHKQGFVAKTTATSPERLRQLLVLAHRP
ncbi:MAG: MYG1 family protein [Verrucomicrobiales bacterium]